MSPPVFSKVSDLPETVPVFPLEGAVLFPHANLPLNIFEPRYLNMVDDAMYSDRLIGMIQPLPDEMAETRPAVNTVGCLGRITSYTETEDGRYAINLQGICRFDAVAELDVDTPYRRAQIACDDYADDFRPSRSIEDFINREDLTRALKAYLSHNAMKTDWSAVTDAPLETLINALASGCPFSNPEKQMLLETPTLIDRGRALISLLMMDATGNRGMMQ